MLIFVLRAVCKFLVMTVKGEDSAIMAFNFKRVICILNVVIDKSVVLPKIVS